jgi:hypothetical protein
MSETIMRLASFNTTSLKSSALFSETSLVAKSFTLYECLDHKFRHEIALALQLLIK